MIGGIDMEDKIKEKNVDSESVNALTKKHYLTATFLASIPLFVELVLYIRNPAYILKLLHNGISQPLGWIMQFMVLALSGSSFLALFLSFVLMKSRNQILGILLFGLVLLIFIFPATYLGFLGPAVMFLFEAPINPMIR